MPTYYIMDLGEGMAEQPGPDDGALAPGHYQPRARHSGTAGRSAPTVVSEPWPG